LRYDLTDVGFNDSFVIAFNDEGEMIGVIGFDTDLENQSVEIWGPFIHASYYNMVEEYWNELMDILPAKITSIHMFPNVKNTLMLKLANQLTFEKKSSQTILSCEKKSFAKQTKRDRIELYNGDKDSFIALHDITFPNTYYSGREIIEKISDSNKVFVLKDKELKGYVYVEVESEFGEASIEFIAVAEAYRGKGIGKHLVEAALSWIFEFPTIKTITLCVDTSNNRAIALYKKAGFQQLHELEFYVKRIE
jgi:ribosomal protein S18 acetylase RimI-like enzyme